jgi:hypothetical protein
MAVYGWQRLVRRVLLPQPRGEPEAFRRMRHAHMSAERSDV